MSFPPPAPATPFPLMVDVGCGSGQSSSAFAAHFDRILGVDTSASQIEIAAKTSEDYNVEFRVSSAEELPVEDGSVSLVTAMCAAHWFDLPRFYAECERILAPDGVVALGVYNKVVDFTSLKRQIWDDVDENAEKTRKLQRLVDDFVASLDWSPRRNYSREGYRYLPMPESDKFQIHRETCVSEISYKMKDAIGFFSTLSGYHTLITKNPESGILTELEHNMRNILGEKANGKFDFLVHYTLVMLKREVYPANTK